VAIQLSELGGLGLQVSRAGGLGVRWSLASLTLAALASCASSPPPAPDAQVLVPPTPPGAPSAPAKKPTGATGPSINNGFTPLPTPAQVLATTPERRIDPFAPLNRPSPATPPGKAGPSPGLQAPITLPKGFQLNGVVSVGGQPQALVTYGSESGSLSPGDQGGRNTPLLPAGWSVAAIDASSGQLLLRQGKRTISARLNPSLL
jgi:hypothetical protein